MNLVPNMPMESYIDTQSSYIQPLSMTMLDELSWPCQFMTPDLSDMSTPYMAMQSYPMSPVSPGSMTFPSHAHNTTTPRQRQGSSISPGSPTSQTSGSPVPTEQGFSPVLQHPRKQDRERRKAQNRASQRAYRERKEAQLRDLAASLKETEAAMAKEKQENKLLESRLEDIRVELDVLRKENEALRNVDGGQESSLVRGQAQTTQKEGIIMKVQGVPMSPGTDEGYDGSSRSNSASVIGTPKDMEFAMEGFDWDSALLGSKEVPTVGPDLGNVVVF